jgi:hypothetical protein
MDEAAVEAMLDKAEQDCRDNVRAGGAVHEEEGWKGGGCCRRDEPDRERVLAVDNW